MNVLAKEHKVGDIFDDGHLRYRITSTQRFKHERFGVCFAGKVKIIGRTRGPSKNLGLVHFDTYAKGYDGEYFVTSMEPGAFKSDNHLSTLILDSEFTSIPKGAFEGTTLRG